VNARVEGVIKFTAEHEREAVEPYTLAPVLDDIVGWRAVLFTLRLVGQDPQRYDGAAYGNISARVPPWDAEPGWRAFVVTGTQTSGKETIGADDLCIVSAYDYDRNRVASRGLVLPSSESLTHGAVYDLWAATRFVFHVHAPLLWRRAAALDLPITRPDVEYGTPAMAHEVLRLFRTTALRHTAVLAMGGHEDGVVAFGPSAREAGAALLHWLAQALAQESGASTLPVSRDSGARAVRPRALHLGPGLGGRG
jgi:L-ribulose-5-phosphate 4-epimerase